MIIIKRLIAIRQAKILKGLNQRELRNLQRQLARTKAEVDFFLDVRNEQGRGGK